MHKLTIIAEYLHGDGEAEAEFEQIISEFDHKAISQFMPRLLGKYFIPKGNGWIDQDENVFITYRLDRVKPVETSYFELTQRIKKWLADATNVE